MTTNAIVLERPGKLGLQSLALNELGADDLLVDVAFSGISTGTERLLWSGQMPSFPGMGYPLVPGYESVGTVIDAGSKARSRIGDTVFVPGANCYGSVRGLFGGASRRLTVPSSRAPKVPESLGKDGVLLALAATAYHALAQPDARPPELIVGHGVLGRLLARISLALFSNEPVVWDAQEGRLHGAEGYTAIHPDTDQRADYGAIYDVSGDHSLLDPLIGRLAKGGQLVLAGFYHQPLQFDFPAAFMREARIRVAAEWQPSDLESALALIGSGDLSLDGLITHTTVLEGTNSAEAAYARAFTDADCLKMTIDWRAAA
ncbi:MAG: chlorophyll synthesis pathway protein BchC [Pseudomonadota bacterium]